MIKQIGLRLRGRPILLITRMITARIGLLLLLLNIILLGMLLLLLRSRTSNATPNLCWCSVHYWVACAINKGGFFEIAFSFVVIDTHLPRFEVLA